MKRVFCLALTLALTGCAAKLNFIDRTDGTIHVGATGSTTSGSGEATVAINGTSYSGPWIYSSSGGGYSLANFGTTTTAVGGNTGGIGVASSTGNVSAVTLSAQGNGLINLKADNGSFIRCVFSFNSLSNTGLGQCLRNDGREYDLTIRR
jgi:hypothetical protein